MTNHDRIEVGEKGSIIVRGPKHKTKKNKAIYILSQMGEIAKRLPLETSLKLILTVNKCFNSTTSCLNYHELENILQSIPEEIDLENSIDKYRKDFLDYKWQGSLILMGKPFFVILCSSYY